MKDKKDLFTTRVSRDTSTKGLAQSIINVFDEYNYIELRAIGASSVNQATKGIATASQFFGERNQQLITTVRFENVFIEGQEKSALVWCLGLSDIK